MADMYWPVGLIPDYQQLQFLDATARSESPFDGSVRTMVRPGQKIRLTLRFNRLRDSDRRLAMSTITGLRGASGRLIVHDHTHRLEGSFPATELGPSSTMANGATGYTAGTPFTLSAVGRVLRLARNQNTGGASNMVRISSAATVEAYAPYVGRVMLQNVTGPDSDDFNLRFGSTAFGNEYAAASALSPGMLKLVGVPLSTLLHFSLVQSANAGGLANDLYHIPFMSVSRCALFDNSPNIVPQSVDVSNAAWGQSSEITTPTTSVALPDGNTGTTNTLHENSAASTTHFLGDNLTVTTMLGDWCIAGAFKAANRSWVQLRIQDVTGSANARANFNLSSGAIATVTVSGSPWQNARAFIVALGDGWYYCALVANNTAANTTIGYRAFIATGDEATSFSGTNVDSLYVWRPTLAQSSVPIQLSATSGTIAETGTAQDLGAGFWTKGWPASTANLAVAGDVVEFNGRKHWVTYPVDSDAAGRAKLYVSPVPSIAPSDNEPVILNQPHGRYFLEPADAGWLTVPPGFQSDAELTLLEAA